MIVFAALVAPIVWAHGHAINAIDLFADAKDSDIYYVGVYDNNYPNEKRYLTLNCAFNSCKTKGNKWYEDWDGEPLRMTKSLESSVDEIENGDLKE